MSLAKITITGVVGSGKSAMAYAIKTMFEEEYGIDVEISGCEDEKPDQMCATWRDRMENLAIYREGDEKIQIETVQARRIP